MALFRFVVVAIFLACVVYSTTTAQVGSPCVEKPFQATQHAEIHSDNVGVGFATFSIPLPGLPSQIQQVSVNLLGSPDGTVVDLRNLTATMQLANVAVAHGVTVPDNPRATSGSLTASFSREVTFFADAGSTARFDATFGASAAQVVRGVDLSIVGLTRTAGCSITP